MITTPEGLVNYDEPVSLSEISKRDRRWDTLKNQSLSIASLFEGLTNDDSCQQYAKRMKDCSGLLCFGLIDDGKIRLRSARFCRVRSCPICTFRRSLMYRARILEVLPSILKIYPTNRYLFLTLTIKNCAPEDVAETLKHLNKSWERFIKRKAFPARTPDTGWIKSIEYTRSEDDSVNVHIHALLSVKTTFFKSSHYLTHKAWKELWEQSLRVDYSVQVHVKAIKPNNKDVKESGTDPLFFAISEVIKYTVKGSDLAGFGQTDIDAKWLDTLQKQLHHKRVIAFGGLFKQALKDIEKNEDLIHVNEHNDDDAPLVSDVELFFSFDKRRTKYMKCAN